jgi:hypothetical protein
VLKIPYMRTLLINILLICLPFLAGAQVIYPEEIGGMQLWLRSDTGVVLDGNQLVSTWQDISGQNRDATNANDAQRPAYPQNAFGPYPVVRFDGTNDFLSFSEISNIRTVFWVVKEDPTASTLFRPLLGHATVFDFLRGDFGQFWRNTGDPAGSASEYVLNGATRLNQLLINGSTTLVPDEYSLVSLVTTGDVRATNFANDRITNGFIWKGDLVELIIYDQPLSAEQVLGVEYYLRQRYAPPVNLGADVIQNYGLCTELSPDWNYQNYTWSTGAQSHTINVEESGNYSLSATDVFGFTSSDQVNIQLAFESAYQTFADTVLCIGEQITWNTGLSEAYNFAWNTGDSLSFLNIQQGGTYSATITDTLGCVFNTDIFEVLVDDFSMQVALGPSDSLCAGNELFLSGGGTSAVSYIWNDGTTAPALPVFETGDYWVEVININGCVGFDTLNVAIQGVAPQVAYSMNQFCAQLPVSFQDLSFTTDGSSIISTQWTIDGETILGSQFQYQFEQFGTYSIDILVETDNGCSAQLVESVDIYPRPNVGFNNSVACSNQLTLFEDDSNIPLGEIISYNWNFGNGVTSEEVQPIIPFEDFGLYTVSLTTVSDQGCDSTIVKEIFVNSTPNPDFNWTTTCVGTPMQFTNMVDELVNPVVNHTWNFGSGLNSNLPHPSFLFSGSGSFLVKHFVHAIVEGQPACFNEFEEFVVVSAQPQLQFTSSPACVGQLVTFTNNTIFGVNDSLTSLLWLLDGELLGSSESVQWLPTEQGSVQLNLQVESLSGCSGSLVQAVLVGVTPQPEFTFTPEIGLPPLEVQFNNLGSYGSFWFWNFGNIAESFEQEPVYTFLDTGFIEVSLIVVDAAGCVGEGFGTVQVMQPVFDASVEEVSCIRSGDLIEVTAIVGNFGNHALKSADLTFWLANGTRLTEHWEGSLARNALFQYTFQASTSFNESINPDYLCVEISNLNGGGLDANQDNNLVCKSFSSEGFELFNAYPVPATNSFTLSFHLQARGLVHFRMYQSDGKLVSDFSKEYFPGFNQVVLETRHLNSGIYVVEAIHRESRKTLRIMVNSLSE